MFTMAIVDFWLTIDVRENEKSDDSTTVEFFPIKIGTYPLDLDDEAVMTAARSIARKALKMEIAGYISEASTTVLAECIIKTAKELSASKTVDSTTSQSPE
jgi:hypothetical protein